MRAAPGELVTPAPAQVPVKISRKTHDYTPEQLGQIVDTNPLSMPLPQLTAAEAAAEEANLMSDD